MLGGGAASGPAACGHPQGLQVPPTPRAREAQWEALGTAATGLWDPQRVKMPFSSWKRLVLGWFLLQIIKDLAKKKSDLSSEFFYSFILSHLKNLGAMKVLPASSSHLSDPLRIAWPRACSLVVPMWWL